MSTSSGTAESELRAAVVGLGSHFDHHVAETTRAIYRNHLDLRPAAIERVDLHYGLHHRHRVDLYAPDQPRAVVIFVHGGGFVAGDKNADGSFYVNVGRWLARRGFAALLPNYRLAPGDRWPAGARDVGEVIAQADSLLAAAGLGPQPVFVFGQSAGASHVASWLLDAEARGTPSRAPVAGVLLMSGFYQLDAPLPPGPRAYFGDDDAMYPAMSPLSHATDPGVPLWMSVAELDPSWIASQTYAMASALAKRCSVGPCFHWYEGHNHVSTVQSLGSPQTDAGAPILAFIERALAR